MIVTYFVGGSRKCRLCVCVSVCVCARARVCVCVCVLGWGGLGGGGHVLLVAIKVFQEGHTGLGICNNLKK